MLGSRYYYYGIATGVVGIWVFHRYVRPMASNKG